MNRQRIWELDALRGICILLVIGLHLMFDLQVPLLRQPVMVVFNAMVGISFVTLSGLCVTLGSRPIRRGLQILGCAALISAVTWTMAALNFLQPAFVIRFGVLHLLGVCMILWPVFRKCPSSLLTGAGLALLGLGYWFRTLIVPWNWLFPLGLCSGNFSSGDYFPLAPYLGWFLLGAVLGRKIYEKKRSILPDLSKKLSFFCWCGRHSLLIYLIHQPILYGILLLLS